MEFITSTAGTLKVALVGAGQVAEKVHAACYRQLPGLELVAVVDCDRARAQAFAERNGIARACTSLEEMLETEHPDIVSICTPNLFHHQQVITALRHGCHVFCEKPPAMSAAQALEMWQAAEQAGRLLAYDFHHRFAEDARILRAKVTAGELGEVYVTTARALRRCGVPGWGNFTDKTQSGGGPLIDIGIHMLDAALYVLGFPAVRKVTAQIFQKIGNRKSEGQFGRWDPQKYSVEDSVFAAIEFCDGGLLRLETAFALNIQPQSVMNVEFCGDKAGATLFPAQVYTDEKGELVRLFHRDVADDQRHARSVQAFVGAVRGDRADVANAEQGYRVQQLVAAIYASAESGESVYL
ncbi:Gfo/Idh/MocA family protein [Rahnella perminowiae]|uniref:Gfo/Idh/MocA family protein n=1 Tax=Rahnella perminowiae TaxID=2816244 RepID=UPI00364F8DF1